MRKLSTNLFGAAVVFVCGSSGHVPRIPEPFLPGNAHLATTALTSREQDPPPQPPPPAKRPDQRVKGKVVDRDGKPVDRAEVTLEGPKKGHVWTNSRGEFSFTGPTGDYTITVKAGERQQNFGVKIEDNQLKPSTLILEPEVAG